MITMLDYPETVNLSNEEFKLELSYTGEYSVAGNFLRVDMYRREDNDPSKEFSIDLCETMLTDIPADITVHKAKLYTQGILEFLEKGQEGKVSNWSLLLNALEEGKNYIDNAIELAEEITKRETGVSMTEEKLQCMLYDLYKLDQAIWHKDSINEIRKEMPLHELESEREGFDKFCKNEYYDESYMCDLIDMGSEEKLEGLKDIYHEFSQEREMQEKKDRYFSYDIKEVFHLSEEVFQHISEVLEKDAIESRTGAISKTLEDAIKIFTPATGAEMLEVLKAESRMDNEKQHAPFAETVLDGALRYDTKFNRKEAYKKVKEWMKKPCDKVAKEIEKLQKKNRAQGR